MFLLISLQPCQAAQLDGPACYSQPCFARLPCLNASSSLKSQVRLLKRRCHLPKTAPALKQAGGTRWTCRAAASAETATETPAVAETGIDYIGLHHVGLLVKDTDRALDFYMGTLGLHLNKERPDDKLPYKGAWLWVGAEMIHLMELPNPDPLEGRPEHGGRDRHTCISVVDLEPVKKVLDNKGIRYTMSKSGRPALFCRDPDENALEISQSAPQHEGSSVKHL
ncbi:Lactoylglutathione lyase / glyoxalase I family protein [Klebsormidium nitens]|uniref:Lactoylglutathione lyase / glyoxalase I family protein n=1 Tax=Klebsormidium nitens TaxID=105231 RepID=A0A1Y1IMJ5_KLENI|nr:Lactoylglutathione lyase / glyoxalase I family protein [Klebsormidium nitens]|eukprot:GAQ89338.1 Lactoylglutathione lyase / glyoxalase I family protein [Klebsormidium nitens]